MNGLLKLAARAAAPIIGAAVGELIARALGRQRAAAQPVPGIYQPDQLSRPRRTGQTEWQRHS